MSTNLLVILGIIGILVFSNGNKNLVAGQCQGDVKGLITECAEYVQKSGPVVNPSKLCCNEIKSFAASDPTCLCKNLPQAVLQLIDIHKVIYVANSCGEPIPSGTKCGGIYNKILSFLSITIF